MSQTLASRLVCGGCGLPLADGAPLTLRCPHSGDGGDHVLLRELEEDALSRGLTGDQSYSNPFIRWRQRLHAWHLAMQKGWTDEEFVALVERLDGEVRQVDLGRGFVITPLLASTDLAQSLGMSAPVWVKDETGNVSGSHKARHLFGVLLLLEVAGGEWAQRPLAIASCGNAALAASVLARAANRKLDVYIPGDAEPRVVERLGELSSQINICERQPGEAGDPCFLRFLEGTAAGSIAFACQGPENGFAIEGGETLGWELASGLAEAHQPLDRLFIQVGGGALASAVARGIDQAVSGQWLPAQPKLHPVQTLGCYPLARAYERIARQMDEAVGAPGASATAQPYSEADPSPEAVQIRAQRAQRLARLWLDPAIQGVFARAVRDRASVMWPWEDAPHSIAHGILDDETYDWVAILRHVFASGGYPVVVSEALLEQANALGQASTGIPVCATGSSGLAGLMALRQVHAVAPDEAVALFFTGVTR